jgi:multidrug efflux pump subunit AcrA (membrane-fusion protein)
MSPLRSIPRSIARWLWTAGSVLVIATVFLTFGKWWPRVSTIVQNTISRQQSTGASGADSHDHDHEGHNHDHGDEDSLKLSRQAIANLGLTAEYLQPVVLETFQRSITVPAIVVERPGRTRIEVSTPMAGVITHVHAVQGEAVAPGSLLFEIRLTAEELVSTQTDLLKTVGELAVENREIARLEDLANSGGVPQRSLLEKRYVKEKLEALLEVQKEALRLHGLSERQIEGIAAERRLLRDLQIVAPSPDSHDHDELRLAHDFTTPVSWSPHSGSRRPFDDESHSDAGNSSEAKAPPDVPDLMLVQVLVHKGQTVAAGTTLAEVADMSELVIEGRAFEQDLDVITAAAKRGWRVSAVFGRSGETSEVVSNLELLYSAGSIDPDSRSLHFYVRLPNQVVRTTDSPNGLKYVEWKHRPGQRLQLQVPVDEWTNQIVLPVDAVAVEGAEAYVFAKHGNRFDRLPVHVVWRDQRVAVIATGGRVGAGDIVARRSAHQLLMALKNKSGGGVDPHAGHNH